MTLFDLAKLEAEIDRANRQIEQEGFWDDPDQAQKVMKEKKTMETTVEAYRALESTLADIEELATLAEDETTRPWTGKSAACSRTLRRSWRR